MPEYTEALASMHTIHRFLMDPRVSTIKPLTLQYIWVDPTDKETRAARPAVNPRAAEGLAYTLEPSAKIMRGCTGGQKQVWPHQNNNPVASLDGLVLESVRATPRTVVLNMTVLILQVSGSILY